MTDDQRPRPTPRPRRGARTAVRPSPRPRIAGSRRESEQPGPVRIMPVEEPVARRRGTALPVALVLLVVAAAAAAGLLLWQRLDPPSVDASVLAAARDDIEALYAYDYRDSDGSVRGKLAVLTGELRRQYEKDLSDGGIIDTYEQVSATTRYEVLDIGLQQINRSQDSATLVVFGSYVVESVNSGEQEAPEGSECRVTAEGAQSCTQTVQVRVEKTDGDWKISELTLRTSS
jgi:hypothetical protein